MTLTSTPQTSRNGQSSGSSDLAPAMATQLQKHQLGSVAKPKPDSKPPFPDPQLISQADIGRPLRTLLLATVLPLSLIPLVLVEVGAAVLTYQGALQRSRSAVSGRSVNNADLFAQGLVAEKNILTTLTFSPLIIDAARNGSEEVANQELLSQPIEVVEQRFASTRILNPNQQLNDYLRTVATASEFSEVFFTSPEGFNVATTNLTSDFFQADEDWWIQARQLREIVTSDPGRDDSAGLEAAININAPIIDPANQEFLGVLRVISDLARFDERLVTGLGQLSGTLGGAPVTQQFLDSQDQVYQTLTADGRSPNLELLGDEAVRQALADFRQSLTPSEAGTLNAIETSDILTFANTSYQFTSIPGTDWITVLSFPAGAPVSVAFNLIRIFLIITPLVTAVVVATTLVIARSLAQPLSNLASTAEQVTQGDLNLKADVKGSQESRVLAQTFNALVTRVKELLRRQEVAAQKQMAAQAEIARQQEANAQEQQQAKEFLQNRALELLMEVSPLRQGDLSIRAKVTEDEIGTIADSYNATIGSLRKIVTQVQAAAQQVGSTANTSEGSMQQLAQEALRQAEDIQIALSRIGEMNQSIQMVAESAQSAEQAMQKARQTVQEGDITMNRTVEGILTIRETVAETAKKSQTAWRILPA
ncbi:MAG: methyl-accepting chemotaxis protein, partial [Synechococcaceae cyanobacterium SM2_3_2]|nr:methyl-accepting chemotaxis protein [Synechococcaceae cyanobacterium SM2_3_2]